MWKRLFPIAGIALANFLGWLTALPPFSGTSWVPVAHPRDSKAWR